MLGNEVERFRQNAASFFARDRAEFAFFCEPSLNGLSDDWDGGLADWEEEEEDESMEEWEEESEEGEEKDEEEDEGEVMGVEEEWEEEEAMV